MNECNKRLRQLHYARQFGVTYVCNRKTFFKCFKVLMNIVNTILNYSKLKFANTIKCICVFNNFLL